MAMMILIQDEANKLQAEVFSVQFSGRVCDYVPAFGGFPAFQEKLDVVSSDAKILNDEILVTLEP
jgi:hypothetical protein